MGFFTGSTKYTPNPYAAPIIKSLTDYDPGIGVAGKSGKQIIKQMMGGDYSGLAGGLLSPIHDRSAANTREMLRNNMMGANAFMQGWQPGLMAAPKQDRRGR